jgi:hypothetical protein
MTTDKQKKEFFEAISNGWPIEQRSPLKKGDLVKIASRGACFTVLILDDGKKSIDNLWSKSFYHKIYDLSKNSIKEYMFEAMFEIQEKDALGWKIISRL